jgi:hypothetical protein
VITRRNFMIGAAGLATLPMIPSFIRSAHANIDPRMLFFGDMEVSNFSDYDKSGGPSVHWLRRSGNTPTISKDQTRRGTQALRIFLDRKNSSTSYRTEVTSEKNKFEFNKTHWIGFSMYVPSDWKVSNTWEVLFQFHHDPADWDAYQGGFSPLMAIRLDSNSDRYLITQHYVQTPESQHQPSDMKTAFRTTLPGAVATGRWTDWVIEYRPDWRSLTDGGTGVTRFWRDGVRVIDYKGPNAINAKNTPYMKFGAYKSAWKNRDHSDPVATRLYYFDELRVSRGNEGSYELVAPGATDNTMKPPKPPSSVTVR